jgi:Zn-dependent metalloprotease
MARSGLFRSSFVASALGFALVGCAAPNSPPDGAGFVTTPEPSAPAAPVTRQASGSHVVPARLERAELEGSWAAPGNTANERAHAFLLAPQSPLTLRGVRVIAQENDDLTGRTIVRVQEVIDGIAVDGHTLLVSIEGDRIVSVRGYRFDDVGSVPAREVEEVDAVDIAIVHTRLGADRRTAEASGVAIGAEEVLRAVDGSLYRAWKVTLETMVTKPVVYVDAVTGDVVHETNLVRHVTGFGPRLKTDGESAPGFGGIAGNVDFGVTAVTARKGTVTGYRLQATGLGLTGKAAVRTYASDFCNGGMSICGSDVTTGTTLVGGKANFGGADARFTTSHYLLWQVMAFLASYGRDSYDGAGAAIRVFTLNDGNDYDNAFYGGTDYIVLGDGTYDGATETGDFEPLVHADVIFHEMGHAVDAKTGGNFEYAGESGALSESWADMQGYRGREFVFPGAGAHVLGADFVPGNWHNEEACGTSGVLPASADCGACADDSACAGNGCTANETCGGAGLASPAVECAADCGACTEAGAVPVAGDGVCDRGKDIRGTGHHAYLRNLIDPKQAHQPDTYGGTYWVTTHGCTPSDANDQCGVHTNSGVGNRWFTLVALGGSGTNDAGAGYAVTGAGSDAAFRIALRAVDLYSTSTDQYADFARSTITAATDLYGTSNPGAVSAVNAAWAAVHVTPAAAPPPSCGAVGTGCTTGAECCSGSCGGKPGSKKCK